MAGIILGISAISIVSAAGTNILANTLVNTANSTIRGLKYITECDNPYMQDVAKELIELDIDFDLNIITKVISEYSSNEKIKSLVINEAIYGVNELLEKINDELRLIKESMEYHQSKYFNSWRGFNCDCNVKTIKDHKKILDKRYKMFIDLIKIGKF